MKYYNSILCALIGVFIVFSSCESQSQEDSLSNLERVVYSDDYHTYQSARHDVLVFNASHDINHDAILDRMIDYPQYTRIEEFDPEIFVDIPFAKEYHKLQIRRMSAMKILMDKYEYLSYSDEDRLLMLDLYRELGKSYYTSEELQTILDHQLKPKNN